MEPVTTRRSTFTLIIIGVLILGLIAAKVLTSRRLEIRYKAAPATSLSFSPSSISKAPNEEFTMDIRMNPGSNQVTDADLIIKYDPVFLEGLAIIPGELFPVGPPNNNAPGTIGNGTAHIVLQVQKNSPITREGIIAQISFKALKETANTGVYFDQSTIVLALDETGSVATVLEEAQVTIQQAIVKDTILSIDPDISQTAVNTEFSMNININTGINSVTATTLKINYDAQMLQGIEIAKGDFLPVCINCAANSKGQIGNGTAVINMGIGSEDQPKSGQGILAVITFRAIAVGTTAISIDPGSIVAVPGGANVNVIKQISNSTLGITDDSPSPTPDPSPTSWPSSSPAATPYSSASPGTGGGCVNSVPQAPTSLVASSTQIGKINLTWNSVAGATHYGIMYGIQSGKYLYGATNVGSVTGYTVSGLASGRRYYFVVFAVNGCASSGNSNEASAIALTNTTTGANPSSYATPAPATDFVPVDDKKFSGDFSYFTASPSLPEITPAESSASAGPGLVKSTTNPLLSPLGGIFLVLASLLVGAFFIFMKKS